MKGHDLTIEALKRRRGRSLHKEAQKGINSPDLEEKAEVDMGAGVREENLKDSRNHSKHSTDDLAPSNEELSLKTDELDLPSLGEDKPAGDALYDEDDHENRKKRGRGKSLLDRVYEKIAKERGKDV